MSIPGSVNPLFLGAAGQATGAGGYLIERSLRFNSPDSAYLSRTPASAGNRKTWTWAGWVKRSTLGTTQRFFGDFDSGGSNGADIEFTSSDQIRILDYITSTQWELVTTSVYRDPSAWYHVLVTLDTTQGTSSDRLKLYVNGTQITTFGTATYPGSNADGRINLAQSHGIGRAGAYNADYFSGYLADIHFIDGQALDPTNFGEFDTNGIWQPKAYTGSYGTNGFHLDFADNASTTTIGYDAAGSNDWTANNLSVTAGAGNDSLVDVPTNGAQTDTGAGGEVRGNYATLNPLNLTASSSHALTNGNLEVIGGTGWTSDVTTFPTGATGKWYAEITLAGTFASSPFVGIAKNTSITSSYIGSSSDSYGYRADATKWNGASSAYGATYTAGDTIGIAYDADAGTLVFYKNGVSQGTAYSGLSGSYFIGGSFWTSSTTVNAIANFGQRAFAYTAPSGFKALNTANLPAPLVTKPDQVFQTLLWTGNNSSPRSITGLEFNPDFVWIKERSAGTYYHRLFDAVRGTSNSLYLPGTEAENTYSSGYANVSSFDSSGFTLTNTNGGNNSGVTYVGWCWDAGSSTVTNTVGSISSQVRANASAGFSVVTWTGGGSGYSVGHGLGVAPKLYIIKDRLNAFDWPVFTTTIDGSLDFLYLNLTNAKTDSGGTLPTSTLVYPGQSTSSDYVMYCFAPVAGYSAFGSYTGNGSADGPFVYTGHKVKYLMVKRTDSTGDWFILDGVREPYNYVSRQLGANNSGAESGPDAYNVDFTSNGFKIRNSVAGFNASAGNYVYISFAEHPFQYSRAR